MVAPTDDSVASIGASEWVEFAGDEVRLAGQIDYPEAKRPSGGYPLIFVIQHGTSTSRQDYAHVSNFGTEAGCAVFRWDKRGTGKSGHGYQGSVERDTLLAYAYALSLPSINTAKVVILAQCEGTLLLAQSFADFSAIQQPLGVILAGNMLDADAITPLACPVHIVISKNDWNDWRTYAEKAADAHAQTHKQDASFYVATNTNRLLMYTSGNTFHKGSESSIKHWLKNTCQIS